MCKSTKGKAAYGTMDVHSCTQTRLLLLTFLQESSRLNNGLQNELNALRYEAKRCTSHSALTEPTVRHPGRAFDTDIECDGELQTDGHSIQRSLLQDVPEIELSFPEPGEEAVREVAQELIRMADEFNHFIVSQVAENLTKELSKSHQDCWWNSLSQGVEHLLKDVPGSHSEQLVMALTFTLVRAVCDRTPRLLRGLYNTISRYTFIARHR